MFERLQSDICADDCFNEVANVLRNDAERSEDKQELLSLLQSLSYTDLKEFLQCEEEDRNLVSRMWRDIQSSAEFANISIPKTLYHYTKPDIKIIECLISETKLKFTSPRDFNDPLDCPYDGKLGEFIKNGGMMCFSSDKDNMLMFSHYSDKHRGLCIGFDSNDLDHNVFDVNNKNIRAHFRKVFYYECPPKFAGDENALAATSKNKCWSYEHEYRLFGFPYENEKLYPPGFYFYRSGAIKEIIFGEKSDNYFNNEVCFLLKKSQYEYKWEGERKLILHPKS